MAEKKRPAFYLEIKKVCPVSLALENLTTFEVEGSKDAYTSRARSRMGASLSILSRAENAAFPCLFWQELWILLKSVPSVPSAILALNVGGMTSGQSNCDDIRIAPAILCTLSSAGLFKSCYKSMVGFPLRRLLVGDRLPC